MRKRQLNWETDYEALKQICENAELVGLDAAADLEALRSGEAAFILESPPAASDRIAVDMARQAAQEMAPEPGRVILAAVLHISANMEVNLELIGEIVEVIQQRIGKDANYCFSSEFCDEGTHFILATAEGRTAGEEETR